MTSSPGPSNAVLLGPVRWLSKALRRRLELLSREKGAGSRRVGESGQAVIEIAIALPLIAAFIFSMIEISLAFYSYCMISETAREGTRYAVVRGATCVTLTNASCTASTTSVNSFVSQLNWPNLGNGTLTPVTSYPDGNENPGSRVQVTVKYVFPYNIPFAPKGSMNLASTSVMYIIQ
jgi:Flp pilus assembly protein TadG